MGGHLLFGLPRWLVAGLALGVAFSVFAAAAFLAGTRLLPGPDTGRDRRTSTEDRRRAEIRAYLDGLGEPFAEDHPVDGQPVAFYLPRRDVAITFDARAYFRIEGTGTHPVLVEHEMPGAALGARLPFETPTPDAGPGPGSGASRETRDDVTAGLAGPGEDPAAAAFARLGLPPDATEEAVRDAYRERVKAVHPDQGGDPEAFQRLREAYTVAKAAAG